MLLQGMFEQKGAPNTWFVVEKREDEEETFPPCNSAREIRFFLMTDASECWLYMYSTGYVLLPLHFYMFLGLDGVSIVCFEGRKLSNVA